MIDPVLLSYSLDGSGGGVALNDGAVSRLLNDDQLAGAHLNATTQIIFYWGINNACSMC